MQQLNMIKRQLLTHHSIVQVEHASNHVADLNLPSTNILIVVMIFQALDKRQIPGPR